MSNEFVIKNGLISQGNITATGSLVVSQNLTASNISASGTISASVFSGVHTGSVFGTSSWATNALTASYVSSSNIVGTVTSASYALSSSFAVSSSFSATAGALVTTNNYTVNNITASATGSFGMIGVGTSSPLGKIDIRPDPVYPGAGAVIVDTDGGNNPRIRMYRPDGGGPSSSYAIHIRNDSGNLNILTSGTNTTLGSETVTSKFYFTSTGRLGIGTTGPQTTLDIIASNAAAVFRTDTSISSSYSGLRIYNDLNSNVRGLEIDYAGSAYAGALVGGAPVGESAAIVTTGAYPLVLGTNNTAKITILSGGNIGIGSSNPTNKLEVVGNISASSFTGSHFGTSSWSTNALTASYVSSSNIVGTVTSASYALSSSFSANAGALVPTNNYTVNNITASATSSFGRIGIGTSTIQNALTIGLVDATSSCLLIQSNTYNDLVSGQQITTQLGFLNGSSANLHFARWTGVATTTDHATVGQVSNAGTYDLQFSAGRNTTGSINYFTSSAVRMTIKSSTGNVGIGTTNPANKFSVAGEAAIGSTYAGSNNAPANGLIVEGNVGIGATSPSAKLHVTDSTSEQIRVESTGTPTRIRFVNNAGTSYTSYIGAETLGASNVGLIFQTGTGGATRMVVDVNGNVGIGTTLPVNKLDVVGNISASSFTGSHFGTSSYAQTASVAISASYAPAGGLSGGTTNYIPLWTGANSLSSSVMYQSGAYVGVGLTNPMNRLDVAGNISCSVITASLFFGTSSFATTAATANALNTGNNYTIAGLTVTSGSLSSVSGSSITIASFNVSNANSGKLSIIETRFDTGNDWTTTRTRIQKVTDTTNQAYIDFNPSGSNYGIAFGTGVAVEKMRIDSSGNVGIGTSSPNTLLNVGSGTPSTAANGLQFGSDTSANLYRISTGVIKTDGGLTVAGTTTTVNALSASGGAFTNDIAVNGLTIGRGNGNSSINTAIGLSSLLNNYTSASFGINNTSIGANALRANTSGSYNTSLGSLSEYFNTIGDYNTAVGYAGLYSNKIGTRNVAVGASALFNNIAGEYNTALGYQASYTNISGSGNIGVGYRTLFNQLSGSYNTAIGYQASSNLTTGSNNIAIGYNAQLSNITSSNEIVIGDNNITLLRIPALGISATTSTLTATNISASGTISASVFSGVHTGSHFGTSSWSTNALAASSLALQTSYTINNSSTLAASLEVTGPANISGTFAVLASSGDNTASVFTVYGDNSPRTPRFTVTREGNVGIGTTNPLARLQLGNLTGVSTATPETISLGGTYSNSTGSNIKLKVYDDTTSIGGMGVSNGQIEVVTWAAGKIAFYRGTTQTAIIDASGNVGIGTTNPVNKLQVAGNISCSAITASNFFGTSSWATNSLTASSLVIANSYQVASLSINTSSVLLPLTIHGTTYSASISGQAANSIFRIGGAGTNAILDMGVNADSSPGFSWLQARSKIDYSTFGNLSLNSVGGNVGVGTTTPSAKLSIGNGSISDGNIPVQISTAASSGLVYFGANKNGAYGALFGYDNSGYGGTVVRNVVSSGSSGDAMSFVVNSTTTAVYIKSDGNVGVGTTSPSYKLQVVGSFSATTKSFDIEHPTKLGKRLVYGSLESPYHGVRLTGKGKLIKGKGVIQLPDYINSLVDFDNANVQITNIKHNKAIYVDNIDEKNNIINVAAKILKTQLNKELEFYWTFTAVRKDVPNLQVEL